MHPLLCEGLVTAHEREMAVALARRQPWDGPVRRRRRPPARIAIGMRLIGLGLRLVDPGGTLPLGHDLA